MKNQKNIWWLAGDRYLSIAKKTSIIENLSKDNQWTVKDISGIEDANDLAKNILSRDLFDIQPTVYIYDGKSLPDAELCLSVLEKMSNEKALIIITASVDGRTKFSKIFKDYLQEFEPAKDGRGFIDDKALSTGMQRCRKLSNWTGSEKLFDFIAENSEYDYGSIIEEIYKLRLYSLKEDKNITEEDYINIGCLKKSQYKDLLEAIKKRNKPEAFRVLSDFLEEFPERSEWINVFHLILETFDLYLFCKMIDPKGNKNDFVVGSEVSKIWTKKGEKVSHAAIGFRYGKERNNIQKRDIESITKSIKSINKAIIDLIHNQNIYHENIIKNTILEII